MTCVKVTYSSWERADRALARIRRRARTGSSDHHGQPIRAYRCADCAGYHLTSTPQRLAPRTHRKAA